MMIVDVLIGTDDGLRSLDGAESLSHRTVRHMVAGNRTSVVALTGDGRVWQHATDLHPVEIAHLTGTGAHCLAIVGDRLLVGAASARLFELREGQVAPVSSFDEAPGRDEWHTPWGGPPDVRSIAVGPDGRVYVNVHVGGVLTATRLGWMATMDISADVHEVAADPGRRGVAYAASAIGLGITEDGGETWRFEAEGLHGPYCRAVAIADEWLFVSASLGSRGKQAALYRRRKDHSGGFERCQTGLPAWFSTNLNTFCVAARGELVVAADANGTVYRSHDAGATWDTAAHGLPEVRCVLITTNGNPDT